MKVIHDVVLHVKDDPRMPSSIRRTTGEEEGEKREESPTPEK